MQPTQDTETAPALELETEDSKRDTMRAPKKVKPKKKTAAQTRWSKTASKRTRPSKRKKDNGTVRTTPTGKIHVMSVHMPLSLLKRLDAKCAAAKKAGKSPDNRSAFAVQAISSRL
jgi:hypothetical protein